MSDDSPPTDGSTVPELDALPRPAGPAFGTSAADNVAPSVTVNVEQRREGARLAIALILLGLLALLTIASLCGLLANLIDARELKDVATALITPVVALVGAATGFYYGGRT